MTFLKKTWFSSRVDHITDELTCALYGSAVMRAVRNLIPLYFIVFLMVPWADGESTSYVRRMVPGVQGVCEVIVDACYIGKLGTQVIKDRHIKSHFTIESLSGLIRTLGEGEGVAMSKEGNVAASNFIYLRFCKNDKVVLSVTLVGDNLIVDGELKFVCNSKWAFRDIWSIVY